MAMMIKLNPLGISHLYVGDDQLLDVVYFLEIVPSCIYMVYQINVFAIVCAANIVQVSTWQVTQFCNRVIASNT
jgi:hypothetical protein